MLHHAANLFHSSLLHSTACFTTASVLNPAAKRMETSSEVSEGSWSFRGRGRGRVLWLAVGAESQSIAPAGRRLPTPAVDN